VTEDCWGNNSLSPPHLDP